MIKIKAVMASALAAGILFGPQSAQAHCDSADGPVAATAQKALDSGNVNLALPYAPVTAEAELQAAFARSLKVRLLGADAKALADRSFMETTVRLHRAGEGAAYAGLKPAGADFGPAIPAAEQAIETGDLSKVKALLSEEIEHALHERLAHAREDRKASKEPQTTDQVEAARKRVSAEFAFVGFAEGLRQAAHGEAGRQRVAGVDRTLWARIARQAPFSRRASMNFEIPRPLKAEHDELHAELVEATKAGGRTGDAAKGVAKLLHPHFLKEEEYALPPLGLLVALSEGRLEAGMADVLEMTDRLKSELGTMLAEHKEIVGALRKLVDAATAEHKPDIVRFAEKLILHAQTEEQALYPAAILVGEFVRWKLAK